MDSHREERRHLLSNVNNVDPSTDNETGGEWDGHVGNGSVYYDSFPRIISPEEDVEEDNPDSSTGPATATVQHKGNGPEDNSHIKVYKRRWYVLIGYSLFAMSQNGIWNTWGPISASAEEAFNWEDSTIAWLNNWGPISYILCGLFFPWLLQVKGLRVAVVSSMVLLTIGAVLRCITSEPSTATILIHIGQFLNGVAGPISMGAIPAMSATWFPPKERITATALSLSIGVFGVALSFILGPLLVSESPPKLGSVNITNLTTASPPSLYMVGSADSIGVAEHFQTVIEAANVTEARIKKERDQIMWYMYYEGIWSVALCLMLLIYFPAKPPKPPSVSAVVERDEYWAGFWSLRKKGSFLVVAFVYGISVGVLNCWSSVLSVNLKVVDISEDTAGWIGFYSTLAASAGSLLMGRFANLFARRMQLFILVLYVLGLGCFAVFTLMLIKTIPYSTAAVWATIIGGTTLINSAVPLMYELACELAYPTSESAANGLLTYLNNVGGLLFLAVFSFPNVGTMWMNWALIGSCVACIPLIGLLRGHFNRLEIDEKGAAVEQTINVKVDERAYIQDLLSHGSVQA